MTSRPDGYPDGLRLSKKSDHYDIRFVGTDNPVRPQNAAVIQKSLANTNAFSRLLVGADAHIGPAECTAFTEFCGEFATSQRADVGIGPYNGIRKCIRIRRKFLKKALPPAGRTESSAPTQTLKSYTKTWGQQFFDRLKPPGWISGRLFDWIGHLPAVDVY